MGKITKILMAVMFTVLVVGSLANAQDDSFAYVGAKRCMPCHMSPAKGAQYKQWMGTKHAQAYKTLGTDEAKQAAQKAGVSGNPQESAECLTCHVTGYDAPANLKTDKYDQTDGVWCESCHGPGSAYWKMNIMQGISQGKMDPAKYGLNVKPDAETCKTCHNEKSPTFKGFNWDEMYPKIAHPIPNN